MERDEQADQAQLLRCFAERVRARIAADLRAEAERAEALRAGLLPAVAEGLAQARRDRLCGRAWLFGSFAWGQPGERSDVDLMVEDCPDTLLLAAVVGERCGRDVHVVAADRAPDDLRARVLADGRPL